MAPLITLVSRRRRQPGYSQAAAFGGNRWTAAFPARVSWIALGLSVAEQYPAHARTGLGRLEG